MAATDSPDRTTTTTRPVDQRRFGDQTAPATTTTTGSGRATAALVLGILAIPGAMIPILGIALGVIGLILGMTARSDMRRAGVAVSGKTKAAIICASIGIALSLVVWISSTAIILSNNS